MEDLSEDEMEDLSEEEEGTNDASNMPSEEEEEICTKYLPTDQTESTQLKKLRWREYSQDQHSTGESENLGTNEVSIPNKRTPSHQGQKFDVFLSHSGKQKAFVRDLFRDLTNQGVSCFFDQDRQSLPLGKDFPPIILEAAKTCRLAVFLLSEEFLQSKWPMLELSTVMEATDTNPHPEILPVFFMIPPEALKEITTLDEKWKEIGIDDQRRVKWPQALKAIGRINGLKFIKGSNEADFRDEIVKEIWHILPTASPRYHVPYMQGERRMCQEVEDFFNKKVHRNKKGISIAGLYGIAGQGKTTLGKAFCNFKLKDFEGKVCHLEFSRGDSFERTKLALQYLIHCHASYLRDLTKDRAQVELHRRVNGQRVLLVLDNITEESIDEVRQFVEADLRESSCILLSARSLDVLVKHCKIDPQSCMRVPSLDEDDAIAILLERTSPEESTLEAGEKSFALKCADRCSFKEISGEIGRRGRTFHPLALKAFGRYLFRKYGWTLSKWVAEIDGVVDPSGYGLESVFAVLGKSFDDMKPKYRTIFMLLTIYILPNMSFHNVMEWLAISCNEEIEFIEEAVEDLCKKAFIEEFNPEIRVHDLYSEFAQMKAKEMGRWLYWKGDGRSARGFISQDNAGFELVKLEGCMCRSPSEIIPDFLKNLVVLQLVGVQNMNKLDLGQMNSLRSITLHDCKILAALDGMENLQNLAWLQIRGLGKALKLPNLSSLIGLQHLEIDMVNRLGGLIWCSRLKEINIRCPSLLEFPRLNGLPYLQRVEFGMCDKVKAPLDCTECVELQSIVLVGCCKMFASPHLAGCNKLSKIVLSDCGAVTAFPDIDMPSALYTLELQISSETSSAPKSLESCYRLENLRLLDMGKLEELPSFRSLSKLTVLEIGECGIREPPDLTCCVMLEDVHFYTLKNLTRFPNFSSLRRLKKLNLCNCSRVRDPPDISGCHQLQLFYLQHNNNMKGISKMDECSQLEEVKVSWQCEDEVRYEGIDPDSCEFDDDLEACLDCFKDVILENLDGVSVPAELEQWMQGKTMLAKKYFRGVKLYYSVAAPYESEKSSKRYSQNPITLKLVGSKVTAYSVNEDCGWLDRVRKYFAGRDIARPSAASGKKVDTSLSLPSSPTYHVKMLTATLANVSRDFYLQNFDPKACHLEFCGGASGRQKLAMHYLIQFRNMRFDWTTDEATAHYFLNKSMEGERILLFLDNITETNIDEVSCYVGVELGKLRCILWTARSVDALNNSNVSFRSFKRLQQKEIIAFLIERNSSPPLSFALKCANTCSFKEDIPFIYPFSRSYGSTFRQLALKALGRDCSDLSFWSYWCTDGDHLDAVFAALDDALESFDRYPGMHKYFYQLERWFAEVDCVDDVFAGLCWLASKSKKEICSSLMVARYEKEGSSSREEDMFKKEIKYIKAKMSSDEVVKWLLLNCEKQIKDKAEDIKKKFRIPEDFVLTKKMREKEEGEKKFRDEIARTIPSLLPQKYYVPAMEGEARMCQKVVDFFKIDVHPNEKGISIAGLYGMPGLGKTTLAKAFCNFNLRNFDGKVYHREFASRGHSMDRQNFEFLTKTLQGQRVLLILDNIETEENIDVVKKFVQADLGENSWILLSAQRVDVLKDFIDVNSCMSVPCLEEKEAIAILLERTSLAESALEEKKRGFALQCANRCSFKQTSCHMVIRGAHTFHPLALKSFGRHLFGKYGSDLSKWVPELDGLAVGSGDGLGDMFTVLDKIFEDMDSRYHTIFMLLTVYMPPNMLPHKVTQWLAVNCKEEIDFIEKAVEDLWQKAFIEDIKPEIRINDLFVEFAQSKARKRRRWLWCNRDLSTSEAKGELFSEDEEGFELAKLEHCQHQGLSQIADRYVKNLCALQVACNEMSNLGLSSMKNIRSLTLHNCEYMEVLQGMENLPYLVWLQIVSVPKLKVLNLSRLAALQYLEINTGGPTELGDLTSCFSLREICVRCPSLSEFPRINGLPYLEKVKFKDCEEVNGPLDCRACVKLRSIALQNCWQMAHIPLIDGCSNISRIVLNRCDQVVECSDEDESSALEIVKLCISSEDVSASGNSECCNGLKNIPLWNIVVSTEVPSLRRFSNLAVLKIYNCAICEPPDVACCKMLEDVCFSTLKYLESFPNFSSLRKLKKLCLCNCKRVEAPPDIGGCYSLQVFHLLYNDNMKRLPKMDGCHPLEEIKLSWQSEEIFDYPDSNEYDDLEFCVDYQKDEILRNINDVFMPVELKEWQWIQNKRVRVKQYFRGELVYYSITAPLESYDGSGARQKACNGDPVEQAIIHRASGIADEDTQRFREQVIRASSRLIPPRIRFSYSSMEKEATLLWLEKASTIKGIHVAGLYETTNNEKTVLCQSFYNFILKGFEDQVSSVEFSKGGSMERLNNALQYLTCSPSLEMTLPISEILDEDACSKGPMFNIMMLLIRYPIPNKFMAENLMDMAKDFHRNWRGNTRIVFYSEMYTILELARP